jgi:hypothetical protein
LRDNRKPKKHLGPHLLSTHHRTNEVPPCLLLSWSAQRQCMNSIDKEIHYLDYIRMEKSLNVFCEKTFCFSTTTTTSIRYFNVFGCLWILSYQETGLDFLPSVEVMVASFYVSCLIRFHGRGKANAFNAFNPFNATLNFCLKSQSQGHTTLKMQVFKAGTFQATAQRFLSIGAASDGHCI